MNSSGKNRASDLSRSKLGFLSVMEVESLAEAGVLILDTNSTLIASAARVKAGATLYPGVVVRADSASHIEIGEGTVLYPGTLLLAEDGGSIHIGDRCELGPGGVQIKANRPGARIEVHDEARLLNGCEVMGNSMIGTGAQILGSITAQSVRLEGGLGGYSWGDPDERGAVLKGTGLARNIELRRGDVLNGSGSFDDATVERQLSYHPRAESTSEQKRS